MKPRFKFADVDPELARELVTLLESSDEPALATQVLDLPLVDRCRCGDDFCAMFYAVDPPRAAWGPSHRNVALDPSGGTAVLDVVQDRIVAIEVLSNSAFRSKLLSLLP